MFDYLLYRNRLWKKVIGAQVRKDTKGGRSSIAGTTRQCEKRDDNKNYGR